MKPLPWDKQLGLASPLQYAAIQSRKTKAPLTKRQGWMQVPTLASLEGREKNFFLDILSHRMSVIRNLSPIDV
jgi:hypothetical protein